MSRFDPRNASARRTRIGQKQCTHWLQEWRVMRTGNKNEPESQAAPLLSLLLRSRAAGVAGSKACACSGPAPLRT